MSFVKLRGGDDDSDKKKGELASAGGTVVGGTVVSSTGATVSAGSVVPSGRSEAYLGQGSKITGNLSFTGPVEIDGVVEGEVHAKESLTIGKAAQVSARVVGTEILVLGTVTGDITASRRLVLRKPAKITGNISCANLSIEEGVIFEGKCVMSASASGAETRPVKASDGK